MDYVKTRKVRSILGVAIDALSWDDVINRILFLAAIHKSCYICICNVHSVITATRDSEFRRIINEADMATPDGAPIAWALRKLGFPSQQRINGPDLMWKYLFVAQELGHTVFFYGSTPEVLKKLHINIYKNFPKLQIAGLHSPPFRILSKEETDMEIEMINRSGANIVFIGLGCPKQEKWMAAHCGYVNAVMVGVGAAFDYHSGALKRAPLWWQHNGMEWLYRLFLEPRRLFVRYLVTNTLFIIKFSWQLIHEKILKLT